MSRVGLGRHGRIEENAGDPLDGLVNLFDIGMILAVAFLIAGIGLTVKATAGDQAKTNGSRRQVLPSPAGGPKASGRGDRDRQAHGAQMGQQAPRIPADLNFAKTA